MALGPFFRMRQLSAPEAHIAFPRVHRIAALLRFSASTSLCHLLALAEERVMVVEHLRVRRH